MSFRTHHGPSFQRLYDDTPNRCLGEACDWYSNLDETYPNPPVWADVVLDYRVNRDGHRGRHLPAHLEAPTMVWASEMPGWALEGFTVRGQNRHTHILRFTDPDGFRGAFVVSGKEATSADRVRGRFEEWGFEGGRFGRLFPTAEADLLSAVQPAPGTMFSARKPPTYLPLREPSTTAPDNDSVRTSRVYHLSVLRDALRDPDGWFGVTANDSDDPGGPSGGWRNLRCEPSPARATWPAADDAAGESAAAQFPDAMGLDCPVSPDRVLLSYAMAGHASYAPVAEFVAAGLDAAELARWRDSEVGKKNPSNHRIDPDTIIEWFAVVGGGGKARRHAIAFIATGISPDRAHRWKVLGDTPSSYADHIDGFEAAGWEPADVLAMTATLANMPLRAASQFSAINRSSFKEVARWTFTTPRAAMDFCACDYTVEQAQALCESAADAEALSNVHASVAAMATLRRPVVTAVPW